MLCYDRISREVLNFYVCFKQNGVKYYFHIESSSLATLCTVMGCHFMFDEINLRNR